MNVDILSFLVVKCKDVRKNTKFGKLYVTGKCHTKTVMDCFEKLINATSNEFLESNENKFKKLRLELEGIIEAVYDWIASPYLKLKSFIGLEINDKSSCCLKITCQEDDSYKWEPFSNINRKPRRDSLTEVNLEKNLYSESTPIMDTYNFFEPLDCSILLEKT
jgi:hypothetical protein